MGALIMLPGLGGSGRRHWHSHWEAREPAARRFAPSSWDAPVLEDWLEALDAAVDAAEEPPVLVAHSLACLLVAHWARRRPTGARGAFLVAPPDEASPAFPREVESFRPAPRAALPFPALIVASADDPYGAPPAIRRLAADWGAGLVELGALGHINAASGLGAWPEGWALLSAFRAGCGAS